MLNWLKQLMYKSFFRNKKIITVREAAIKNLSSVVSDYSDWYEQFGIYLPPGYETDPTAWTNVLQKMKRAFQLLAEEMNEEGELWEAKNHWKNFNQVDTEKINDLEREIKEGLTLFGTNLIYMTDLKKGVIPGK